MPEGIISLCEQINLMFNLLWSVCGSAQSHIDIFFFSMLQHGMDFFNNIEWENMQ
jgi:hypothetical protein